MMWLKPLRTLHWRGRYDVSDTLLFLQERFQFVGDVRTQLGEVANRIGRVLDDAPVLDIEWEPLRSLRRTDYYDILASGDGKAKLVHNIGIVRGDVSQANCCTLNFLVKCFNRDHGFVIPIHPIRLKIGCFDGRCNDVFVALVVWPFVKRLKHEQRPEAACDEP